MLPGLLSMVVLAARGESEPYGQYGQYGQDGQYGQYDGEDPYGPGEGGEDWGAWNQEEYARGLNNHYLEGELPGEGSSTEDRTDGSSQEDLLEVNKTIYDGEETSGSGEISKKASEETFKEHEERTVMGSEWETENHTQDLREDRFEEELKKLGEVLLVSLNGSTGHIREMTNALWSTKDRIAETYDKLEGLNKEIRSVKTTEVT